MRLLRLTLTILLVGYAALAGMAAAAPPAGDWPVSTPEEQGMDSASLAKMLDIVQQRGMTYHSIVIVRSGVLVLDANFYPYDPAVPHELASTTKSVTGTLVGIAIQQGYIESVDQPALDFFPEVTNPSPEQQAMTIRHLLTMTSGLMCGTRPGPPSLTRWLTSGRSLCGRCRRTISSTATAPRICCRPS
jgi:CubicO group peptidase (beta-lactamase class C family)